MSLVISILFVWNLKLSGGEQGGEGLTKKEGGKVTARAILGSYVPGSALWLLSFFRMQRMKKSTP